jgi:pimeloyl-ACP methyl ester carboxylesterase
MPPTPTTIPTARGPVECLVGGEGTSVVLILHGAMGGWDQSALLMHTIGEPGYRTIAVSRPGYLGTPLDAGRTPEAQADLLAALLEALGIPRAAVIAVSGGGPSAIHFALRHSDRCWALVLVSTAGGPVTTPLPLRFHLLKALGHFAWFRRRLGRRGARDPEASARRSIPDPELRRRTLADPDTGPLFRRLTASSAERVAERLPGTLNDVAVTRSYDYPLEALRVPTLVVHGGADRVVPFADHGRTLASRIPGARLVTASDGGHVFIFTHRRLVQPAVCPFLREHAPRAV